MKDPDFNIDVFRNLIGHRCQNFGVVKIFVLRLFRRTETR